MYAIKTCRGIRLGSVMVLFSPPAVSLQRNHNEGSGGKKSNPACPLLSG